MIYTTFVSVVFNRNVEQVVTESTVYRYIYVIIANLTYFFILYLIVRIYKNKINLKKSTDIVTCFVIPVLTMTITFLATAVLSDYKTSELNRIYLGCIVIIAIVIAFAMFSLMHHIGKSAEISAINSMMVKEQELYKTEIVNQSNYIEDISRVKHEMKNKLFCIRELLRSGRVMEAQKMCEDAESELGEIPVIFSTDNIYLNALLNMAYKRAVDNQIEFSHTIKSNLTDIEESDLISLLGNLIDNAIEALQKLKSDKYLHITIFEKDNYYMFSVKNSISASVFYRNPKLETTKTDKRFHGHGLKIVKQIVKKYNGNISFSENDSIFDVSFMLERGKR
ncbi:MAG: GHKL domain-containing protein [Ruminococcaceae bacterium]|nr:GHKL domain-containing protein [Oscillospiraceae bacterium]